MSQVNLTKNIGDTNIGLVQFPNLSCLHYHVRDEEGEARLIGVDVVEDVEFLQHVKRNLMGFIIGVLAMHMVKMPPCLQCHVLGVPPPFLHVL